MRRARGQGLTGWVRNRRDGSVEALLQGPPERLDDFCAWLRDGGVPAARVEAVETTREAPASPRFAGFERLPTA